MGLARHKPPPSAKPCSSGPQPCRAWWPIWQAASPLSPFLPVPSIPRETTSGEGEGMERGSVVVCNDGTGPWFIFGIRALSIHGDVRQVGFVEPWRTLTVAATTPDDLALAGAVEYPTLTSTYYQEWSLLMRVNMQAQGFWYDVIEYREDRLALAAILRAVPSEMIASLATKRMARSPTAKSSYSRL
uniref:DUF4219 domain-containing protein n=1 Tax=Leersia perrieri TaxID=77586 RepID=A0A0D9XSC3_9ORYZ